MRPYWLEKGRTARRGLRGRMCCAASVRGGTLSDTLGQALSRLMQALFCESGRAVFAVRGGRILLALEKPAVLPRTEAVHSLWELRRYAERNLAVTPNFAVLSPAPAGADPGRCLQALIVETGEDSAGVCWLGELPPAQASLSREERVSFARQNAARLWALNSPKKIYAAWRTLERLADASAGQEQEEALDALAGALGIWRGAGLRGAYEACREALCTLAPDDSDRHEMGQVVALVLKNLHREVKLSEAAGKVGFHEVYFSALFKQQMGMGFARFCVQMRMEHAKRLLKERSISTCQVAEMCGYRDMAYFYRVFKQNVGVTPTAWRDAP